VATSVLGTVTVGDLRLTPFGSFAAASVVSSGNSDINNAITATAPFVIGAWDSFDADGDALWTSGDVAYIDGDANGIVTVIDVRLGGTVPVSPGGTPPTTPPTTTPPTTPPGGNGTTPPTPPSDQMAQLQAQLAQLLQQNTQLNDQLQQSLQQNTALSGQISALNTQMSNQTAQLTSLNTQLSTLRDENAKLKDELAKKPSGTSGAPGFEAIAALAAIGGAGFLLRRKL